MLRRIAIMMAAALVLGSTFEASADCAEAPPIEQAYEKADQVFVGQVLSRARLDPNDEYSDLVYRVRVSKTYKGELGRVVVIQGGPENMCPSYVMEKGETHLLWTGASEYEDGAAGRPYVGGCDRHRLAQDATEDIAWLESRTEAR